MSNYSSLKATINANVKANGNQEITGPVMNSVLNAMVDSLGTGYQYNGKAVPSTNPGTPDSKVYYLASEPGTYTNFNGIVVSEGEVAILKWDTAWSKEVTGAATAAQVTQLGQEVTEKIGGSTTPELTIEQGNISNTGEDTSASNRIRTSNFVKADAIRITTSGNKVYLRGYKNDGTYVGGLGWITTSQTVSIEGADKYRFLFAFSNDATIVPADFPSLGVSIVAEFDGEFAAKTQVAELSETLVSKIDKGSVAPKDIKHNPFLEDFRFCTILPNKAVSSVTTIDGKRYITWNDSTPDWYTIAINIRSYKDLVLVSDILPQSVISRFLTVGIDTGETNIEFVAWVYSNESFSFAPNAYIYDETKMTITLFALLKSYGYRGNIVLYIKMPNAYKINWLTSGMQLEGYDWMKIGSYAKAELKEELRSDNVKIVMPSTIYTVVGHEMNIYFDGVVQCDDINRYDVDFSMGSMTTVCKLQNERLRIFPNVVKTGIAFVMNVYDKMNHEVVASKSFTVKANTDTKFEKKVIFIGDSLTDRCIYPVEICQELGDNKLVSLGTRFDSLSYEGSDGVVTATNFANEGRGGWSARTYTQFASSGGVVNAFWNPSAKDGNGGFDFAYYMNQNNFDSVDCVAIVLGPNDISTIITGGSTVEEIVSCFREMVDSIHSYNSGIKVIVSLPPHSAEPNGVGTTGPAYNVCQKELVDSLIAEFDGETNVYLAPVFANIDYHNDYPYDDVPISARNPKIVSRQNNNVHFSKDSTNPVSQCWGYLKMADAIWYTMVAAFGDN